jgi:hypothetical protein
LTLSQPSSLRHPIESPKRQVSSRISKDQDDPALPAAASLQSTPLLLGRTALRFWCRPRLALFELLLLRGMLLLNLLRLLRVALLHLLLLRDVVVFPGGLLVLFSLLLLELLMILRLLGR